MAEFTIVAHGMALCCKLLIYPHVQKTTTETDPQKPGSLQLLVAWLDTEGVGAPNIWGPHSSSLCISLLTDACTPFLSLYLLMTRSACTPLLPGRGSTLPGPCRWFRSAARCFSQAGASLEGGQGIKLLEHPLAREDFAGCPPCITVLPAHLSEGERFPRAPAMPDRLKASHKSSGENHQICDHCFPGPMPLMHQPRLPYTAWVQNGRASEALVDLPPFLPSSMMVFKGVHVHACHGGRAWLKVGVRKDLLDAVPSMAMLLQHPPTVRCLSTAKSMNTAPRARRDQPQSQTSYMFSPQQPQAGLAPGGTLRRC